MKTRVCLKYFVNDCRLLTLGILFSIAVNAAVVGKPVILDILPTRYFYFQ